MNIFERFGQLLSLVEDTLEKGERKIIRAPASGKPAVSHGIKTSDLSMHTGNVRYAPAGTPEKPHDHATYSEHVILHHNKPIGYATVHHSHPSDHGKIKGGKVHDHSVDIHAPGVDYSAHSSIATKVKEHINSKEFKSVVDQHNKDKHDYHKPKLWLNDKKKK